MWLSAFCLMVLARLLYANCKKDQHFQLPPSNILVSTSKRRPGFIAVNWLRFAFKKNGIAISIGLLFPVLFSQRGERGCGLVTTWIIPRRIANARSSEKEYFTRCINVKEIEKLGNLQELLRCPSPATVQKRKGQRELNYKTRQWGKTPHLLVWQC